MTDIDKAIETAKAAVMPFESWERLAGESGAAFAAFCAFRDFGPERNVRKAVEAVEPDEGKRGKRYRIWRRKRGLKGQAPFLCRPPLYYPFTNNGLICSLHEYATAERNGKDTILNTTTAK